MKDKTRTTSSFPPTFPIVGIGASAGGLAAFEAFFSGLPSGANPDLAFILVQHLAPDHKSILSDLIGRYTRMHVCEVQDGMRVEPGYIYIIPPNHDMALLDGALQLLDPVDPRGRRMPIDFFFCSLAQDLRERAICVILSGTGTDGSQGLRAVKGEGGLVIAQVPESAEYDGMPRSAIATGMVDYELPPAEMPARILAYVAHPFIKEPAPLALTEPDTASSLKKILLLLRSQTGHDFSQYKTTTISRRIHRRMAMQQIGSEAEYAKYAQLTPTELQSLFRDLLIGVTSFFRNADVFSTLEKDIIPSLLAGKNAESSLRVWVPSCSTGEEAYSIAILLAEAQVALRRTVAVQIFATDIDGRAIEKARKGLFPASIAVDVSPDRLSRFFTFEAGSDMYRIHKSIRDLVVFSEQDLVRDPPFSRLDLLSCRNFLIYLKPELQKKLIPLFHYALKPDGFLLLGNSETIGEFEDLFSARERSLKIFQRKQDQNGSRFTMPGLSLPSLAGTGYAKKLEKPMDATRISYGELTERALLKYFGPVAALVTASGDILYLHGRTGRYLEPQEGEAGVNNIMKMAREGLRHELSASLLKASAQTSPVFRTNIRVKTNGDFSLVNLGVIALPPGGDNYLETTLYLVVLERAVTIEMAAAESAPVGQALAAAAKEAGDGDPTDLVAMLRKELEAKEEYLKAVNEELQSSNEEMKSSNEEMQSMNEELQSTNEELETSKEELQSVNEELATINAELQTKVVDLSRSNNDMNNLLSGTGIGTVFVDLSLNIMRFTPTITGIINLIPGDIGRPIAHVVTNLMDYNTLVKDTQSVLDTLVPKEMEVLTQSGAWYTLRIQPYRTLENVIEGAVLTFVDISAIKKVREALRQVQAQIADAIAAAVREPLLILDARLKVIQANGVFYGVHALEPDTVIGRSVFEMGDGRWDIPKFRRLLVDMQAKGSSLEDLKIRHDFGHGVVHTLNLNARRLLGPLDTEELYMLTIEDATDWTIPEKGAKK